MTIYPPMEVLKMYRDGLIYYEGNTEYIKEDAPEYLKKIWADWQKEFEEAMQFQASMK